MKRPTLQDVLAARQVVARYLPKTPLHPSTALSRLLGADVFVKYENHHSVGAFKVRGGIYCLSRLTGEDREAGVVTASTGNHAQSIAYAARTFGVRACILMPEGSNPDKVDAVRGLGGEVIFHGRDFDEARLYAEQFARDRKARFISSADEPDLIAGVGTMALEVLEDLPNPDIVIVPIGGGSSACGNAIVYKGVCPRIQVLGVQAAGAPAVCLSYREGRIVETPEANTSAEGLATRVPFALTFGMIRDLVDDICLVTDDEIDRAILLYLRFTHNLAEGAGAAPLAAAIQMRHRIAGKRLVLILSGGNLTVEGLRRVLNRFGDEDAPQPP